MDERQRAEEYIRTMCDLQVRTAERDKLDREIEDLQDRLTEMWGEMGDYARSWAWWMGAER